MVTLLETREPRSKGTNFVFAYESNPDSWLWQQAQELEYQVFRDRDFVSNWEDYLQEYEPYRQSSDFIVCQTLDGEIAGAMRAIRFSGAGFKTINDAREGKLVIDAEGQTTLDGLDLERTVVEFNIVANEEFRGNPFTPDGLFNLMASRGLGYTHRYARQYRLNNFYVLGSLDASMFKLLYRQFTPAVWQIGPAIDYMGSPTVPTLVDGVEMIKYDSQRANGSLLSNLGMVAIA